MRWYTLKNDMAKFKTVLQQEKYFLDCHEAILLPEKNNMNQATTIFFNLKIQIQNGCKIVYKKPCLTSKAQCCTERDVTGESIFLDN